MSNNTSRGGILLPSGVLERLPFLREAKSLFFDFGIYFQSQEEHQHQLDVVNESSTTTGGGGKSGRKKTTAGGGGGQQTYPVALVLTDTSVIVATFPLPTLPTKVLPLEGLAGVSRDGDKITLRNSGDEDITLQLPKADTLIVHLIDIQDRGIGRSLRLSAAQTMAGHSSGPPVGGATASSPETMRSGAEGVTTTTDGSPLGHSATGGGANNNPAALNAQNLDKAGRALRHAVQTLSENDEAALGVIRLGKASVRVERPPREIDEGSDASSVQTIDHEIIAETELQHVDIPAIAVNSTALHRRLFYFFQHHDRSKLAFIPDIVNRHRGKETQLMAELEQRYGPEPQKIRWETRDHIAHQREINVQLKAQLRRAKDELLLLAHEETQRDESLTRVLKRKEEILASLEDQCNILKGGRSELMNATGGGNEDAAQLVMAKVLLSSSAKYGEKLNGGSTIVGSQQMEAYFPVPPHFFDYVREQAELVPSASLPPLCTLSPAPSLPHGKSSRNLSSAGNGVGELISVNVKFLAMVAMESGPFTVSVQKNGKWSFVPYNQFWGENSNSPGGTNAAGETQQQRQQMVVPSSYL